MKATRNQLANTKNFYQGPYLKVLFVCSAGLLRSATAAHIFSAEPYNWNTRSAASNPEYGLNPVNEALLEWADIVFAMETQHVHLMRDEIQELNYDNYEEKVIVLGVPDDYEYRDPKLVELLKSAVERNMPDNIKELIEDLKGK